MDFLNKKNIISINLFIGFFLAFSGFYAFLVIIPYVSSGLESRALTIPLRLIILVSFGLSFLFRPQTRYRKGLVFFLLFALAYLTRILVEYVDGTSSFHMSIAEFFLYFMSFVLLPILFISFTKLRNPDYNKIFYAIITSSFLLSILSLYFYKEIIGVNVRISTLISREEQFISPLALSYCSALCIGAGTFYLLTNRVQIIKKVYICLSICLSTIPFFLGASRGSIFALAFPFIYYLIYVDSIKNRFKIIIIILFLIILSAISTEYLGNAIFTRTINTFDRIEVGTEGRILIYKSSLDQFFNYPIFGNGLNNKVTNYYPHNMFLEVMITTGIIGFLPFVMFIIAIFAKMKLILKKKRCSFWICVVFLQSFTSAMFSGGIYAAAWFAIGVGLILGFNLNNSVVLSGTQ